MNGNQMNFAFDITLIPEGDEITSLWDLIDRYDRKTLLPPLHQRDTRAWDEVKKKEWVKRIGDQSLKPVGVIVTYQLNNGQASPIYLNDGLQRITATSEYRNHPEIYGASKDYAENILRSVRMPIQHRHYKDEYSALLDFQRLNSGTHLTPYEFFAGILRYMPGYEIHWQPLIESVHKTIIAQMGRVCTKPKGNKREAEHQYLRSDLGFVYRFLARDISVAPYRTGSREPRLDDALRETCIEKRLKEKFLEIGLPEVSHQLEMFKSMIERETHLIELAWSKTETGRNIQFGITPNLYRHIIDAAIWKRNKSIGTDIWHDYVRKLLIVTQGRQSVINPTNPKENCHVALNDLSKLRRICKTIKSNFYTYEERLRDKRGLIKPGGDDSHILPLAQGNETLPEPASLNRARGARPMSQAEIEFVRA